MGRQGTWDDVGGNSGPFEQMALPQGESRVRLLIPDPWYLHEHWVDVPGVAQTTSRKIVCSGDENCLACKRGLVPSKRNYIPVIDRADKKAKILEGGVTIFGEIKKFKNDAEYGDPTMYDIKIFREGTNLNTSYSLTPSPNKTPLTEEELALFAALPSLDLYNPPMSVEEQRRIFMLIDNASGGGPARGQEEAAAGVGEATESSAAANFFKE